MDADQRPLSGNAAVLNGDRFLARAALDPEILNRPKLVGTPARATTRALPLRFFAPPCELSIIASVSRDARCGR